MRQWALFLLLISVPAMSRGLQFDRMSHNFGKLLQHKVAHWSPQVTNKTDHPIKLLQLRANCGCTVPIPEKKIVAPGETVKINITFDSGMFEGPQEKIVKVITDEPYDYILLINANVVKAYSFSPPVMNIRNFEGKAIREVDLSTNIEGKHFTIERMESKAPCLTLKKNSPTEVEVTVTGDECAGEHTVLFYLSGMDKPVYYRVALHLMGEVKVQPRNVLFMGIRSGTKAVRSIALKWSEGDYKVEKMTCDVPFVRITGTKPMENGIRIMLESIPDKMKKGYGTGNLKIRLKTGSGKVENLTVPVAFNLH
ncbi:MAG: DUF1573 domain-containing protein [Acidobacteria bacterium]|nr:DUF1573 domain-containing protein [Acidobacteriota bacterium]